MRLSQQPQTGCNNSKSYLLKNKSKTSNKAMNSKPNNKHNDEENVETKATYSKLPVHKNGYFTLKLFVKQSYFLRVEPKNIGY